ncbi:hypothetical protein KKA24_02585 [Patescibacteria group bacterium]|nr:hypothetical protein [Patescibacteria group bacterium]
MQIFEFHFNPKTGEEKNLDSFIYEPETNLEKKMGNLYLLGEVENISASNSKLLDGIAQVFKKNYYSLSIKSLEKSLSNASKKVNEFLAEEVKKENIGWLGNLNFGIVSVDKLNLNFTKTGNLKIILLRAGQIVDIGKNLENQEIDPYPLKIFFNVVSGKLIKDDRLVILTKNIYDSFQEKGILDKLAQTEDIDSKKLKDILPETKISGACLIVILNDKKEKPQKEKIVEKPIKKGLLSKFPKIRMPKLKLSVINFKFKKKDKMNKLRVPVKTSSPMIERFRNKINFKKGILPIIGFIIILSIGFYFFKATPNKQEKEIKISIEEIQGKISEGQNLLIFNNEKDANNIFQEAWSQVLTLNDLPEALTLKETIKKELNKINKIEIIENPEIVAEVNSKLAQGELEKELAFLSNTDLVFQEPSQLYILKNKIWIERTIDPPSFKFNPTIFASYFSNLYLLDRDNCEVAKYSHLSGMSWGEGKQWLQDKSHCSTPKSLAVDGSLYILNSDNSIAIHHSGQYQKTLTLDIFPKVENITEIKTKVNVPYLYLLEPINNRLIIIDKDGKTIKQFQSDDFNNLIDFDISPSGKTIYLLNENLIYKKTL